MIIRSRKKTKGFTLVELVVVIAIVAILGAVSVTSYLGFIDKAHRSATSQVQKQVQDMWQLFAIDEFDESKTPEENAYNFCVDFAEKQGFDDSLNYYPIFTEGNIAQTTNLKKAQPNYSKSILFKIDVEYPTWFITNGKNLVKEGSITKTDKEFRDSILKENLISQQSKTKLLNSDFNFEIKTLGVDENQKPIRGKLYHKVKVMNSPFSPNKEDNFVVKDGETITSVKPVYTPKQIYVNNVLKENIATLKKNGLDFDTNKPIQSTPNFNELEIYQNSNEYVTTNEIVLNYNGSVSPNNYDLLKYQACLIDYAEPEEVLKDIINPDGIDDYGYPLFNARVFKQKNDYVIDAVETNVFINESNSERYYFYTQDSINLLAEKFVNETTGKRFLFLNNLEIKKNILSNNELNIPKNTVVVMDYLTNTLEEIANFMQLNHDSNLYKETHYTKKVLSDEPVYRILNDFFDWGAKPYKGDIKKIDLVRFNESYEEKIDGYPINLDYKKWSKPTYITLDDEKIYDDKLIGFPDDLVSIDTKRVDSGVRFDDLDNFDRNNAAVKNKVVIDEGVTIKFNENSSFLIEGKIYAMINSKGLAVGDRVELVNNGTIILNNTTMKVVGEVTGNGTIVAENNSRVSELFRANDYSGGTFSNLASIAEVMPFTDYYLDNIKCKLIINYGSDYGILTALRAKPEKTCYYKDLPFTYLISSSESVDSLFVMKSANCKIIKDYDENTNKINLDLANGEFADGGFSITAKVSFITLRFDTTVFGFPMSNINLSLLNSAKLTINQIRSLYDDSAEDYLTYSSAYNFLPNSSLRIDNTSEIVLDNGGRINFIRANDFKNVNPAKNSLRIKKYKDFSNMENTINLINEGTITIKANPGVAPALIEVDETWPSTYMYKEQGTDPLYSSVNINGTIEELKDIISKLKYDPSIGSTIPYQYRVLKTYNENYLTADTIQIGVCK